VGFVTKNMELHIRGGRAGEVLYIVDGVETKDPLGGLGIVRGGMEVSADNIEEISVLKGGFDAEYGNVQSAVINLVTKEGSVQKTTGHVEFLTDDFGDKSLNKYSFNSDRIEMSLSGPEPILSRFLVPLTEKFSREKLAYRIGLDAYKTDTYFDINSYATPKTEKKFVNYDILGIDVPDRIRNFYSATLKLSYKASPNKKFIFSYKSTWDRYTLYFDPTSETRGDISVWKYRYTPSTLPNFQSNTNSISLLFTHNVSKKSFYELQVSRYMTEFLQRPGDPNKLGASLTPGDFLLSDSWERYTDVNLDGKWDPAEPYIDVNGNGKYDVGEPFVDQNKGYNGKWDPGEPCSEYDSVAGWCKTPAQDYDRAGAGAWSGAEPFVDTPDIPGDSTSKNGKYDPEKARSTYGAEGIDEAEPYVDGDKCIGEPFTDMDGSGDYNYGIDLFVVCGEPGDLCLGNQDLNYNGIHDGSEMCGLVPDSLLYIDYNHNNKYDKPNGSWDPGEPYKDLNGNGRLDGKDGFYDRGHERRCYYQHRQSTLFTVKLDFTSQITKEHQIRTGIMVERDKHMLADLRYPYYLYDGPADGGPWPDRGAFRDFYTHRPIRGAWYIQDKIEYGAMIAKLGFRYDWLIQSKDVSKIIAVEDPILSQYLTEIIGSRHKFSPRLGISYPITDKAKVYFNYGYFYQLPELHYMYASTAQGASSIKLYGNPNIDYLKNISYEVGVEYALSESYKLNVSGFYKDYFGQVNTLKLHPSDNFQFYTNVDYGRARGLELELNKKYGGYISGYVTYQYAFAYGKSSAEVSNYYATGEIPIEEFPLDWDIRHQMTLNLDLRIPKNEHPKIFGIKVLDNWGVNVSWQYGSGSPFTPDSKFPGLSLTQADKITPNSMRMPSASNTDLRFNKDFSVWKLDCSFIVWVTNLFNTKNVNNVYTETGRPDTRASQNASVLEGYEIYDYVVLPGSEWDQNPYNYGAGRNVRLGFSVNF
ncbi:MAG: TonB-dependent receptor, partial [candidate division Zixibacteria bacterium]|nr:TonB-dependent receptor [candidate division Zixibacteria bacterium]